MYDVNWLTLELHPDYEINNYGTVRHIKTKRIVKPTIDRGYYRIRLNGKRYYVHKLVMETFYDEIPNRYIKFKNKNKLEPYLDNLEYIL